MQSQVRKTENSGKPDINQPPIKTG